MVNRKKQVRHMKRCRFPVLKKYTLNTLTRQNVNNLKCSDIITRHIP